MIGDDSIGEPTRKCQRSLPVARSSTRTIPSIPCTTRSSPTIAGEEAILPPRGLVRQITLPLRMSSA